MHRKMMVLFVMLLVLVASNSACPEHPHSAEDTPPSGPNIEGTISVGGTHLVIIDRGFYEEGETVLGLKIVEIEYGRVLFENNGERFYIKVKGGSRK